MQETTFYKIFRENLEWFERIQRINKENFLSSFEEIHNYQNTEIQMLEETLYDEPERTYDLMDDIKKRKDLRDKLPMKFSYFQRLLLLLYTYSEIQKYFTQCFSYILNSNPDLIKNLEKLKIKYKDNLNLEENVSKIIYELFFGNFSKIFEFARELNIEHNINQDDIDYFNYFKLARNLYAHGKGKLDEKFFTNLKKFNLIWLFEQDLNQEEKRLEIDYDGLYSTVRELVGKFDEAALRAHYGLGFLKKSKFL